MGEFADAGKELVGRLGLALYANAREIMAVSQEECPISDEDTYVPQYRTRGTGPGRQIIYLGDDPLMVGDAGTLRRSARVFPPRVGPLEAEVTMGYGYGAEVNPAGRIAGEYAVPVHEVEEYHHDPPTKSHFLLDPVLAYGPHMEESLAHAMDETVIMEESAA